MLNQYLEKMASQARQANEMASMSAATLAKMAGVKLSEGVCPNCAAGMEKSAGQYKCASCGMTKAAKRDMPSFAKQDRPAKVKEVYKAIKRDHPNMPAEVKARIASRKGKASPQARKPPETGGPAYKAPLGYTRSKGKYVKSAAALLPIGYEAGRAIAKMASIAKTAQDEGPQLDPENFREAYEEAMAREDIGNRMRRGGILGGIGGTALGAGLGSVPGALMGSRLGAGAGALLGGAGGAYLGHRMGSQFQGREALADRAVQMARAINAYRAGRERGAQSPFYPGR
jgi:hypothetical protein